MAIAALAVTVCSASAQSKPVPKRGITGGGSFGPNGVGVIPAEPKTIIEKKTYLALSGDRAWKSADGKAITAKLLAFDEGNEATFLPPTVVKDAKVRLLMGKKEFIMPLERLDASHRAEVLAIEQAVKKTYEQKKAAAAAAAKGD
jgi:hypothetical protein